MDVQRVINNFTIWNVMDRKLTISKKLLLLLALCVFYSCNATKPYYENRDYRPSKSQGKQVDYSLFLIGDTGAPQLKGAKEVLHTLRYQLHQAGENSSVVFLGDNLYADGMPPEEDPARQEAELKLKPALDILRGYSGDSFFIPGNHDWRHGIQGLKEQEDFIEQYPGIRAHFTPDNGCPGPVGINLGTDWQLIVLDSEWWATQSFSDDSANSSCELQSRPAVMRETKDLIDQADDKNVLIAFHHSLYSNGTHGGYYSLKDHIFPLTNIHKYAYVPLPLIGSLYPITREVGAFPQDMGNAGYAEFKRQLLQATEDKEHVFFASGHEHSLSFYQKDKANIAKEGQDFFILSGSGSKKSYARKGYGADFVYSQKGFAKLVSYTDGSVAVEFWVAGDSKKGRLVYRKQLLQPSKILDSPKSTEESRQSAGQADSVNIAAGPGYEAGGFKRFIWGDHYRDAWTTQVQAPVLDLDTEKGGLNILKKTGGVQTVTIIAEDSTGRKYVMRSVQKDPTKSLPEELQQTFAADIAKDQTSATHPYGGEVAAALASAAGVYHTTPELRYIPGQSAFDLDTGKESGTLVTIEEFVSRAWFNETYGKKATEIIGTDELWERLRRGSAATINERQLVRSRIFDMYIGDWDRHEKQWFWAERPTDTTSVYEPIPIDRDNAFYRSDGLMLGLARRLILPKFQNFGDDIDNIKGINLNAQHFDRWFINELSRDEWIAVAREMQKTITDSAITSAVNKWPEAIRKLNGDTFIEKLKARRSRLPEFAGRYYDLLMRQVNVYGSTDDELFIAKRLANGKSSVAVYRKKPAGEKELRYQRTFKADETDEIRLYGFDGEDQFKVQGKADQPITIRIIGGTGDDRIQESPSGTAGRVLAYDTKDGSSIESYGHIKAKTTNNPAVNRYEKRGFQYGFIGPLISSGYNETDGLFLGGGVLIRREGFRKEPFASLQKVKAKTALRTSAFSYAYEGIWTEAVGSFDLEVKTKVNAPNRSEKYFGLGNNTSKNKEGDFYNYRMDNVDAQVGLAKNYADLLTLRGSLGAEYYYIFEEENRFITSEQSELSEDAFGAHYYTTVSGGFSVGSVDQMIRPKYGTKFDFLSELKVGLNTKTKTFGRVSSNIRFYYTFRDITTTLANKTGFATNIGSYPFYQANSLGGESFSGRSGNLRGFVRDRFGGHTTIYNSTELRTKLFDVTSYFIPGTMGVLAFLDEGRVWAQSGDSSQWHFGYGGSLWFSPLDSFVLTAGMAFSSEEALLNFSLGFPF